MRLLLGVLLAVGCAVQPTQEELNYRKEAAERHTEIGSEIGSISDGLKEIEKGLSAAALDKAESDARQAKRDTAEFYWSEPQWGFKERVKKEIRAWMDSAFFAWLLRAFGLSGVGVGGYWWFIQRKKNGQPKETE